MALKKWGTTYLELFDNKLSILGLEMAVTGDWHVLTLDSLPDSYMLLISVSSTPISFCWHLDVSGYKNANNLPTIFLLEPTVATIMLEDSSEST